MPNFTLPDLCDAHADCIRVAEPIFQNYGGKAAFGGQIVTVKCFEDNSKVKQLVATPGQGKVLVVDGGGSKRHALLGDMLMKAQCLVQIGVQRRRGGADEKSLLILVV